VDLCQPVAVARAVAGADRLVEGGRLVLRRAGFPVEGIAEAEGMKRAAPRLEEGHHLVEIGERTHAGARVVASPRVRHARVALLPSRGEFDDLVPPLRPARGAEGDAEREADIVKTVHVDS